jgi:hypothetical protein
MLTVTISALKWTYRLAVLGAIAFAFGTYVQLRQGAPGSRDDSYANELQQALAALKELARALQ